MAFDLLTALRFLCIRSDERSLFLSFNTRSAISLNVGYLNNARIYILEPVELYSREMIFSFGYELISQASCGINFANGCA